MSGMSCEQKSFLEKSPFSCYPPVKLFLPLVYTDPCWRIRSINNGSDFPLLHRTFRLLHVSRLLNNSSLCEITRPYQR